MDGRKPLNPIFNNNHKKKEDPLLIRNVRKKPITKDEGRKTRIDKKKDVKIPLSDEERKLIKRLANRRGLQPTPFCSLLVKKALTEYKNAQIFEYSYDPKGKPYPAKLEVYYHDLLFDKTVEWDCSLKEAAYRLLKFMLIKERDGHLYG